VSARKLEHLSFNLYNFNFFRKSERGKAILFFGNSRLLAPLIAVPYVLGSDLAFFRKERYFVKLKEQVVGIFVLREKCDALYVSSLAVEPEYRRYGIATYILMHCAELASGLGKKWLELTVLKRNSTARRLYEKSGFVKKEERKWSLVLKKSIGQGQNSFAQKTLIRKS
jgi:ribosomal protein S18 acetylase RimI-like enzyme